MLFTEINAAAAAIYTCPQKFIFYYYYTKAERSDADE